MLCAAAPGITAFTVGRAIEGLSTAVLSAAGFAVGLLAFDTADDLCCRS